MKNILILSLLFLLSCSDTSVNENVEFGKINISLNKADLSDNISLLRAELSRTGFETMEDFVSLSDTELIEVFFNDLVSGVWHLTIEALDVDSVAIYHGSSDIDVLPGEISPINMELVPVGENLGGIIVNVSWESLQYNWFDHPQNPLLRKLNSTYDDYGVMQPYVFKDDNEYKMYFTGLTTDSETHIFLATSQNGLTWERISVDPVLSPSTQGSWDSQHVSGGPVIKVNDEYWLYYSGWSDYRYQWHIGMAVSQDGIHWEKRNSPVLSAGQDYDYRIGAHSVIKVNDKYIMYYGGQSYSTDTWAEYVAVSDDGINWTKYREEPILQPENDWESTFTSHCSVIMDNGKFVMIYTGRNDNGVDAIGLAISEDGFNWVKNPNNPIITQSNIRTNNYYEPAYPNFIKTENEYRIYYTGMLNTSNTEICVFRKVIE